MTHLSQELKNLRENLSDMAKMVSAQLEKAVESLLQQDNDLANEVIIQEKRVNALELKIDRDCEHIFALLTPVAHDMRFVFATLKINADLERIADYAEGIARLVLLGNKRFDPQLIEKIDIRNMTAVALEMMKDATKAYCEDDTKIARSVFSKDLILNEVNSKASGIAEEWIKGHLDNIQPTLLLLSMIRKVERIGDHITNIAEEIIFYKEARVLRHSQPGKAEGEKNG